MFPWFWIWSPQWHLPWSGDVAQKIAPQTSWFFDAIAPNAGDGRIEQAVFETASYGKQLGKITEALLALPDAQAPKTAEARAAVAALRHLQAEIEAAKTARYADQADALIAALQTLRSKRPDDYARVARTVKQG